MFDLDREVATWSAAVHAGRCQAAAGEGVTELSDHLYCEIERGRAAGLSDEEAFRAAVVRMGTSGELTAEIAKNRSPLGVVCRIAAKLDGPMPASAEDRRLLTAHAVVWATLLIASSMVLTTTTVAKTGLLLILLIYIPLWQVSDQLLRRALRKRPAGRA